MSLQIPQVPQNFQTYIQQATSQVQAAKTGMKLIKDLDVVNVESALTSVFSSYLATVFGTLGNFRQYIPHSLPSLPGPGGIGGIGSLSIPNCGLGSLNNNAINTLGISL